jgi:ABC-2 type transport system permease protein
VSLAWWVSSSSGYHAVMSIVLIPMWVLSGAMFPLSGAGKVVGAIMTVNPMRFSVEGLRAALYGDGVTTLVSGASGASSALFLGLFAAGFFGLAAVSVSRRD